MGKISIVPSGTEISFDDEEIIVSKTDLKGRLTYANDIFLKLAGYSEKEVLGEPHSIVRHPDMPRSVFKLLWDSVLAKKEIFAYVVNLAKNGDHYWVLAHVTPSFDADGNVVGFHSNRRKPEPDQVATIRAIYSDLVDEENRHSNRKDGMHAGVAKLNAMLAEKGVSYDEFVFSI